MNHYKLIIIGSGPAGCTAAIYAYRANLNPLIITGKDIGGQLSKTNIIDNWPGEFNNFTGYELVNKIHNHILKLKINIKYNVVKKVNLKLKPFKIYLDNKNIITCNSLIIATGSNPKKLGLINENKLIGKGISYCAICDGNFYKNEIVAVIGGGNSAVEYAIYLSKICKLVYLIHRHNLNKIEPLLFLKLKKFFKKNIVDILNYKIISMIEYHKIKNNFLLNLININNNKKKKININGLFIAIGHIPNTYLFKNQLILNKKYNTIKVFPDIYSNTKTSINGIFACGDVTDYIYKQALTASSNGCMAALDAYNYLIKNENNK